MFTLFLIGLVGGLITGISPCILPVLPVIFFSGGVQGARSTETEGSHGWRQRRRDARAARTSVRAPAPDGDSDVLTAERPPEKQESPSLRPYLVILGLVVSFSFFTLAGSLILSALHLPQDFMRWAGLVVLIVLGLGFIFPKIEDLLEKPFAKIPQRHVSPDRGAFPLGLALGVLYVPCAGPILAAITIAGASGRIGVSTVVLTIAFALGAAIPLLTFALAGRRVAERVKVFRLHARKVRVVGGILMIVLALALATNLPAKLQTLVPGYTQSLQKSVEGSKAVQSRLPLANLTNGTNEGLSKCTDGSKVLQECGPAPQIAGIQKWLNTPGDQPIDLKSLHGKVVLIDFWTYSCINCQRAIPHVVGWDKQYKDAGLQVIGVHTPEFAFEKETGNVIKGAADLHVTYPIAQDNKATTWDNYRNSYWPAEYLIDAEGNVRHIQFGEGDYDTSENLIRTLLQQANPDVKLPAAVDAPDTNRHDTSITPETYLTLGKYERSGNGRLSTGVKDYSYPAQLAANNFAFGGTWDVQFDAATAQQGAGLRLNYRAKDVYLVLGGSGTVTVKDAATGETHSIDVKGSPTIYHLVTHPGTVSSTLDLGFTPKVQAYSFTFG